MVNNLRDIPTDQVGKRTHWPCGWAIATPDGSASLVASAAALVLVVALTGQGWAAIGLAGFALAVSPVRAVLGGAAGRELIAVLGDGQGPTGRRCTHHARHVPELTGVGPGPGACQER